MSDDANISAYFERVGFAGSIAPNLQTLQLLAAAHPAAIPFENLNPLLDRPVRLDQKSLEQKLLHERRGGYCFEQNLLFMRMLRSLGYEVRPIAARVLWGRPADAITPRSHMALAVDLGGATWLCDVGFGGTTPTAPLRLRSGAEQETPHDTFRILGEDPALRLEIRVAEDDWRPLYRFDLSEQHEVDFAAPNWFAATHPDSIFRTGLTAARAEKARRLTLHDTTFTTRPVGGESEKRELTSVAEVKEVLAGSFGISLPAADNLDAALDRVLSFPKSA
jgi:N-hydroxyarylamine O-acetyltransferase